MNKYKFIIGKLVSRNTKDGFVQIRIQKNNKAMSPVYSSFYIKKDFNLINSLFQLFFVLIRLQLGSKDWYNNYHNWTEKTLIKYLRSK